MSKGSPGRPGKRFRALAALVIGGFAWCCSDRDRLTFPAPGNGVGPTTQIDRPQQDTFITAGPNFIVNGLTVDPDGVDTVYFLIGGGKDNFQPFIGPQDSVRFGLPLTTSGLAGHIVVVEVFATDTKGNRGDTATRVLNIQ